MEVLFYRVAILTNQKPEFHVDKISIRLYNVEPFLQYHILKRHHFVFQKKCKSGDFN